MYMIYICLNGYTVVRNTNINKLRLYFVFDLADLHAYVDGSNVPAGFYLIPNTTRELGHLSTQSHHSTKPV